MIKPLWKFHMTLAINAEYMKHPCACSSQKEMNFASWMS